MHSVGIDIGKRQHVAAICRAGQRTADKPVLRFSADRAGLADLEDVLAAGAAHTYAAVRHLVIGDAELGLASWTLYDHDFTLSRVLHLPDKEMSSRNSGEVTP